MQNLRRLNGTLLMLAGWIAMAALAAIAILVPYEVVGRYGIGRMSTWTNEFCQYAVVWATMMGGAVGLKRGMHVGITSLTDSLPPGPCRWVQGLGYVCMLVFLSLMTYYGFDQTMMNRNQTSSTVGISMSIPYAALPIGFLMMLLITVEHLADFLTAGRAGRT